MAEGKKSFVLYVDQRGIFEKLSDKQSGALIKHIFAYVSDENPEGDFVTELAFESIMRQLKRDLKKYEKSADRSRLNGKLGGRPKNPDKPKKPSGFIDNPEEPRKPDTDTDTVTDTVTDTEINSTVPSFNEFKIHADSKGLDYNKTLLRAKYDSWIEKGWKDRNGVEISVWKSLLTATLPYILNEKAKENPNKPKSMTRTW